MQNVHFSPPELSRMLGVNESTIKRWIDKGLLKAEKTPGGHRRVSKKDIQNFLKESTSLKNHSYLLSQWGKQTKQKEWEEYYDLHVNFQPERARSMLIAKAIMRGSVQKVLEMIVVPALVEIGEAWNRGEIDIVDEHRVTFLIRGDLLALEALLPEPKDTAPRIALACVPEENHELMLIILSLIAREKKWNSYVLGINVPLKEISRVLDERDVDALGITKIYQKTKSLTFIKEANKVAQKYDVQICVGGSGWNKQEQTVLKKLRNVSFATSLKEYGELLKSYIKKK